MASKNPEPPRSLGRQLNFTTGRLNALCEKTLAPYDLTLPQWVVLSGLWREGPLTVSTLSALIGTGLPATSRLVDRMAERELVTRKRDAEDARITVVEVTEAGHALNHLATFYEQINAVLMDGFSEAERDQIFDLLKRMERNVVSALA
ncbi:MAG: MarR family transcriptional regulator [Dinoroseobacter sp.]|nr:MarR family transcriptional regulator [Dinoroseobacter sp.]MDJ0992228.1 MarR family transcriptional regulator [Dinoroseobacter sp.]